MVPRKKYRILIEPALIHKLTLVFLLIYGFSFSEPCRALSTDSGADFSDHTSEHYAASFALVTGTYAFLRHKKFDRWEALLTSMAVSLTLGYAKENTDAFLDPADNRANVIGAVGGGAFVFTVDVIAF